MSQIFVRLEESVTSTNRIIFYFTAKGILGTRIFFFLVNLSCNYSSFYTRDNFFTVTGVKKLFHRDMVRSHYEIRGCSASARNLRNTANILDYQPYRNGRDVQEVCCELLTVNMRCFQCLARHIYL